MTGPVLIRQGGLRFWWDWEGLVSVTKPDGTALGRLEVRADGLRASLDEVHDAIDAYCSERGGVR